MNKQLIYLLITFSSFVVKAQEKTILLTTNYGSDNVEINDILRFQGIETNLLTFKGKGLKGKDYILLIKEFSNGSLTKIDTVVNSKSSNYISSIKADEFKIKYFVKTEKQGKGIKMLFKMPRFSITKNYAVKKSEDDYALHDFLGSKNHFIIKSDTPTYVLGYFLPYLRKDGSGFKSYCDVSGSKYKPEEWGEKLGIPNYFLIEIAF